MTYEIIESLGSVGYDGSLMDENIFSEAINEGFKNDAFRNLVIWLSNETSELAKMEEKITPDSDISSFMIELSGFLKEIKHGYEFFSGDGNISNRLQTVESKYLLLEFLVGELMTQKMLLVTQKPKDKGSVITIHESPTAAALKDIAITLNLGKPPDNISFETLFAKINSQLERTLKNIPDSTKRIGKPLFNPKKPLNDEQWHKVEKIQALLEEEYNLRRKMLMTRLDVTIQSFKWSERIKGKEKDINERYSRKNQDLEKLQFGAKRADIPALLAARDKLAIIEKTSSANVRKNTKSKLQRHIIGRVPDRGGRALENQKPPPEMPSWQKRQPGGDNRGGGQGFGNRGGGGYQGGDNRGGGYQRGRGGGYQGDNRGGGYPPQQFQQRQNYNPSNQPYSGGDDHQNNRGHGSGFNRGGRGGGGRVQGGWNQSGGGRGGRY